MNEIQENVKMKAVFKLGNRAVSCLEEHFYETWIERNHSLNSTFSKFSGDESIRERKPFITGKYLNVLKKIFWISTR